MRWNNSEEGVAMLTWVGADIFPDDDKKFGPVQNLSNQL
jgi:hypothetical protein